MGEKIFVVGGKGRRDKHFIDFQKENVFNPTHTLTAKKATTHDFHFHFPLAIISLIVFIYFHFSDIFVCKLVPPNTLTLFLYSSVVVTKMKICPCIDPLFDSSSFLREEKKKLSKRLIVLMVRFSLILFNSVVAQWVESHDQSNKTPKFFDEHFLRRTF